MEANANEKNDKKNMSRNMKLFIYMVIIGLVSGLYYMVGGVDALKFLLVIILQMIVSYIVVINIHEFGHFIVGKLYGYRLLSYRIGFFSWSNENGKMKLSIVKNRGYAGLCAMVPPEKELPIYRDVLFYAGGILFNIFSGIGFTLIVLFIQNNPVNHFFIYLAIISILIGSFNLIPMLSSNNPSDGKVIWSLLFKKPFAEKILCLKRLTSKLSAGIRPSHLQIPNLNTDQPESMDLYLILYAYYQVLDKKDDEQMLYYANLLEENINHFPTMALPGVYYELCYVNCITKDLSKATNYYQQGGKNLKKDQDINGCRVKAYYEYYVNQNPVAAKELCKQGLTVKEKFPIKGQAFMEEDLLNSLIRLINKHNNNIKI